MTVAEAQLQHCHELLEGAHRTAGAAGALHGNFTLHSAHALHPQASQGTCAIADDTLAEMHSCGEWPDSCCTAREGAQVVHTDLNCCCTPRYRRFSYPLASASLCETSALGAQGRLPQPARAQASSAQPHAEEERSVWLHNTMSGRKEKFHAREGQGNKVSMYCCGVTVYDFSHIGAPCPATMHAEPKQADLCSMLTSSSNTLMCTQVMHGCTAPLTCSSAFCSTWDTRCTTCGISLTSMTRSSGGRLRQARTRCS